MSKSKNRRSRAYLRYHKFRVRGRIKKSLKWQDRAGYYPEDEVCKLEKSRPRKSVHSDNPWGYWPTCFGRWRVSERYTALSLRERIAKIREQEQLDELDEREISFLLEARIKELFQQGLSLRRVLDMLKSGEIYEIT